MTMKWPYVVGILMCSAGNAWGAQTGRIEGTVSDAEDGTALVGAAVVVLGTALGTVSNSEGRFVLERVPVGQVRLTANLIGYRPATLRTTVAPGETSRLAFRLAATVIEGRPLVVTSSRRLQDLRQSPTALDIVTPEHITGRNVGTVQQSIEYIPGTTIIGGQVSIRGSSGFTQGAGSRVGVLLDGVPVLSGDAGDVKWDLVPPEVVERVEVAKGPSSALYGSGALGGVINQITREPGEKPETRLRLVGGWYASLKDYVSPSGGEYHRGFSLTHTQQVGLTKMLANLRRDQDDGARSGGDATKYNLFVKLERPWNTTTDLGLLGIYNYEDHGQTLQSYPDSLHYTRGNGSRVTGPDQFASFWVRQVRGSRWSWRVTTHLFRTAFDETDRDHEPVSSSDAVTGGAEGQVVWLPHPRLTLTAGAAALRSWVDADMFQGKSITDLNLFGQAEVQAFSFAALTAGLHYDRRSSDVSSASDRVSPRIGLVLTPTSTTTLRALLSSGFRGPTISELSTYRDEGDLAVRPNSALKPERSWSAEAGISQTVGKVVGIDFGVFENRYRDMIEPTIQDTTDPATGKLVVAFDNVLSARIRGFEAAARVALWRDRLLFQSSYMLLDTRNESPGQTRSVGADSLRLPYRPRHTVRAGVELHYGPHFAGYDYRYISSYPVTVYPNDPRTPQIVSDVRAGTHWRNTRLTLSVTNLFNYVYAPRERRLSDPRRYSLSIDMVF